MRDSSGCKVVWCLWNDGIQLRRRWKVGRRRARSADVSVLFLPNMRAPPTFPSVTTTSQLLMLHSSPPIAGAGAEPRKAQVVAGGIPSRFVLRGASKAARTKQDQ